VGGPSRFPPARWNLWRSQSVGGACGELPPSLCSLRAWSPPALWPGPALRAVAGSCPAARASTARGFRMSGGLSGGFDTDWCLVSFPRRLHTSSRSRRRRESEPGRTSARPGSSFERVGSDPSSSASSRRGESERRSPGATAGTASSARCGSRLARACRTRGTRTRAASMCVRVPRAFRCSFASGGAARSFASALVAAVRSAVWPVGESHFFVTTRVRPWRSERIVFGALSSSTD
jgi:hypothetical protein